MPAAERPYLPRTNMTLKEIVEKCVLLKIDEERFVSEAYYEVVFFMKDTDAWKTAIAGVFGAAAKPAGIRPTKDDLLLTKEFGGIHDNQTLFKKELNGMMVIAMFWPWADGAHITLKVAVITK
ncbi:MAG: hypothetical protein ABIJ27_06005 [Candidatus Omnitrophota bacterium]